MRWRRCLSPPIREHISFLTDTDTRLMATTESMVMDDAYYDIFPVQSIKELCCIWDGRLFFSAKKTEYFFNFVYTPVTSVFFFLLFSSFISDYSMGI